MAIGGGIFIISVNGFLAGGVVRRGVARSLDEGGRLVVELPDGQAPLVVSAGDVTHLRHDDSGIGDSR